MINRKPAYANISLAPPEPLQANFSPPTPMQMAVPQMEEPDTGGQLGGIGALLLGRKRFGAQGDAIKGALSGGVEGKG